MSIDPLSALSNGSSSDASESKSSESSVDVTPALMSITSDSEKRYVYAFEEWNKKKSSILKKYTTSASIPVVANFMDEKLQAGLASTFATLGLALQAHVWFG